MEVAGRAYLWLNLTYYCLLLVFVETTEDRRRVVLWVVAARKMVSDLQVERPNFLIHIPMYIFLQYAFWNRISPSQWQCSLMLSTLFLERESVLLSSTLGWWSTRRR